MPSSGGIGPVRSCGTETQALQAGEATEFGRDRAGQVVVVEKQSLQAGEVAEFGRDRARQIVGTETQALQAGEATEFGRDRARQIVGTETQALQAGEVAEFGRDRAGQVVVVETQPDDSTGSIHIHSIPIADRRVGQPVFRVDPVRPVRRFIKRHQRCPVRVGAHRDLGCSLCTTRTRRDHRRPYAHRRHQT